MKYMKEFIEAVQYVINFSTAQSLQYASEWHYYAKFAEDSYIHYYIEIDNNEFGSTYIAYVEGKKTAIVSIGNYGIHIGDDECSIHSIKSKLLTEEEYFQKSLLVDLYGFEYKDFISMVEYQNLYNIVFPTKGLYK